MAEQLIGKILDRKYQLVRLLGEGGMGAVYEAEHTRISRKVAVKVMHSETKSEPDAVERFLREAEAASAIGHPNIIEIFDVGLEGDGTVYIVMELLNGVSLDVVLKDKGALPPSRAVAVVLQILSALNAAHRKGIIHRDLKPENVFIAVDARNREEVKLLDFGVAKVQEATGDSLRLTRTGTVLGTPSYLSPEQARGRRDIDERIDIWAAGVLLYQMLAGELPFKGDNYNEVLANVLIEEPKPLTKLAPQVPEGLAEAVRRAMTKNRDKRFQTVAEMIEVLLPFCEQAEYEMTPKAFEVLRKSIPPPPPLPLVDSDTGMPAIPPASPVPDENELLGDGSTEPEPYQRSSPLEATLSAPLDKLDGEGPAKPPAADQGEQEPAQEPAVKPAGEETEIDSLHDTLRMTPASRFYRLVRARPREAAAAAGVLAGALLAVSLASGGGDREQPEIVVANSKFEPNQIKPAAVVEENTPAARPPVVSANNPAAPAGSRQVPAAAPTVSPAAPPVAPANPSVATPRASVAPARPSVVAPPAPSVAPAKPTVAPAAPSVPLGKEVPEVTITLRGVPAGATVTLGGQKVQPPIKAVESDRGTMLRVTAPHYLPFQRFIKPDRDQTVVVRMKKGADASGEKAGKKTVAAEKGEKKKSGGKLLSNPFK